MDVQERHSAMTAEIILHNERYYVQAEPKITDQEYDKRLHALIKFEKEHPELDTSCSPTKRVGGEVIDKFTSVNHDVPMLSIGNTYNQEEVEGFVDRVNDKGCKIGEGEDLSAELKIDGVAISVTYKNGKLVRAVTRGDGESGDDVTHTVRTIHDIPLTLTCDVDVEVRGEIYMEFVEFDRINKIKEDAGEKLLMNPRNAAAGILKRKNSTEAGKVNLRNFMFRMIGGNSPYQSVDLNNMRTLGFRTNQHSVTVDSKEAMMAYIARWDTARYELSYPIDGVVVKVDSAISRDTFEETSHHPKWLIAYKFPAERRGTKLLSIGLQVGKSGIITPVAHLQPILLAGTMVKKATLHNFEILAEKDIREGDMVLVEKAGEIIPQVVGPVPGQTGRVPKVSKIPKKCPVCRGNVKKVNAYYICSNPSCPAQLKGTIEYFVKRDVMDIDNIGDMLIAQLIDTGLVKTVADLYTLTKAQLLKLERIGEKSADNILAAIEKSKEQSFNRVLCGMQIHNVGRTLSKILANKFLTIDDLIKMSKNELMVVDGIGELVADGIIDFFDQPKNIELVTRLKGAGLNMATVKNVDGGVLGGPLKGKKLLGTGKFKEFTRVEFVDAVRNNGGKIVSTISKRVDYLVVGEKPSPGKVAKAKQLKIPMLSEAVFLEMVK